MANSNYYPGKHGQRSIGERRKPRPEPAPTWYRAVSAWTSREYFGHRITAAEMVEVNEIASALDRAGEAN